MSLKRRWTPRAILRFGPTLNRRGEEIFQTLSGIPLVVILCAQLLLDHTSFVYHIAGILFGSLVYAGAFDWLTAGFSVL